MKNTYNSGMMTEQDEIIQSLNISEMETTFIGEEILKDQSNTADDEKYLDTDFTLQNMKIDDLKKLFKPIGQKYSMQHKITRTGLDENTILLIETNKYRASLGELINYCNGLHLSYKEFLPELFRQNK